MKKNNQWKRQIGLSLLFSAGFGSIYLSTYVLIFGVNYVLERFGMDEDSLYTLSIPFLILSVGFLIASLFTYVLLEPLDEIMDSADRIAKGDYSVRVHPRGFGKLPELGEKFNHMAEELNSVETLRSDFVNNFSHEFKTPIVSIRGFAKMLQREDLSEEERTEYLNIIIRESERLAELSTNILTLSKIEKQNILTNTVKFNASEQIRLAIAMLDTKWTEKNIEFVFDSPDIYVTGNKEMLNQVWINLLDNAMKFSPDGGTVHMEIKQTLSAAHFTIRNSGVYIPPEKAPYIFDKFYQSEPSHATKGNGVGLAIVKKIVSLHKGDVRLVQSDENATVFEVVLPLPVVPAEKHGVKSLRR